MRELRTQEGGQPPLGVPHGGTAETTTDDRVRRRKGKLRAHMPEAICFPQEAEGKAFCKERGGEVELGACDESCKRIVTATMGHGTGS